MSLSSIWQNLGLSFVIVLAGLQAIPAEVDEAATLDGYGPVRRFFRITLPLISPVLMFLVVVLVVFALQAFAQIEFLTQGGPARSTETLVFKIFQRQAPDQLGEGAVMSVGLFVVTFVVTLGQFLILDGGCTMAIEARRARRRPGRTPPAGSASAPAPGAPLLVRASSRPVAARAGAGLLPRRAGHLRPDARPSPSSVAHAPGRAVRRLQPGVGPGQPGRRCCAQPGRHRAITALQVLTSVLAAYAFAFLRFPFKRVVFAVFMATLLLPLEVTLLPNLQTIRDLGWFDSYQGLIVPFAAAAFGTFLIRQGFLGIPGEIRDATRLEGWGHLQFLCRFAVPLTRPVIASFTVISFLGAFNQYLWPRAVITDTAELGHDPDRAARPHDAGSSSQHPRGRRDHRRRPDRHPPRSCSSARSSAASPPAR